MEVNFVRIKIVWKEQLCKCKVSDFLSGFPGPKTFWDLRETGSWAYNGILRYSMVCEIQVQYECHEWASTLMYATLRLTKSRHVSLSITALSMSFSEHGVRSSSHSTLFKAISAGICRHFIH